MVDLPCKRDGCGHLISVHTTAPAEKRAKLHGTMISDYPTAGREEFNIHAGRSNSACDDPDCSCIAFISPNA